MRRGIAGELPDEHALLETIRILRERGYTRLDAFSPYLIHDLDAALGRKRSPLSLAAGIGALSGAVGAYALQWYLVAYLYPIDVGGRPPHMPLPFLIITIEMGFLIGALTTFVAFLIVARLFKLWDPVFDIPGIESATRDRFWVAVDGDDERFDREALTDLLRDAGAARIATFGGIR
jgi:hypothetical protein